MSHFTVMVIGDNPEGQLEPYDANLDVDEYVVGKVSDEDKTRFIDVYTEFVINRSYGPQTEDEAIKDSKLTFDDLYSKYGKGWNENLWRKDENDIWMEYSSYNPNSKWDWYKLGGRWSGEVLKLKDGKTGVVGEPGVFNNPVGVDCAKYGDIDKITPTFAVVKNGIWYQKGDMGWWGRTFNEKQDNDWNDEFIEILNGLSDDTLITIYDCHI